MKYVFAALAFVALCCREEPFYLATLAGTAGGDADLTICYDAPLLLTNAILFVGKAENTNRVLVTGTSRIECTGVSVALYNHNGNSNEVRSAGLNAYIRTTGNPETGRNGCSNRIVLANNPAAVVPGIRIGRSSGINSNTFELPSGAICFTESRAGQYGLRECI